MGVVKKKRSHHAKTSRQQYYTGAQVGGLGSMGAVNNNIPSLMSFAEENNYQYGYGGSGASMSGRTLTYAQQQLNKQRQDFERVRLRPEQLSNIIHDESDTISFRSNLLKNFISSNDAFNMLSLTTVPCDRIGKSRVFSEHTMRYLRQKQLDLKAQTAEQPEQKPPTPLKYTDLIIAAENGSRSTKDLIDAVFDQGGGRLRHQPDDVVVRRDEAMLVESSAAILGRRPQTIGHIPYKEVLAQYHEARLRISQKEATASEGPDEACLQGGQQQQQQDLQRQQQVAAAVPPQNPHVAATEKESVPAVEDDALETMFGDYSNEPFSTNFDDEFGDLDAVFF
ncbi:SNF6-like protein [Saccharomyces kudriavzevii IFO 1802]|uniref:SNF6-like protein n=1 Tax=Saccharomyces kudriavzevii (strain ATCC MYA-4449 / AS 2.2408 / CBS 8840 / NBRC 1802 / NCYC 2889) TaxID=226230 RepID=J5PET8_SACK1|nr:SNF6-like protein [Saccharomyces kudriavzevii IFO 1802]